MLSYVSKLCPCVVTLNRTKLLIENTTIPKIKYKTYLPFLGIKNYEPYFDP